MHAAHRTSIAALTIAVLSLGSVASAVDRTWGGGSNGALDSGTHLWNVPGNWSGDNVPNGFDVAETAVIGDATGTRNITMDIVGGISSYVQMTQTSEFVNKLTLADDIRTGSSGASSFSNTSSSAANMVVELNGNLMSMFSLPNLANAKMQILSTTPGGRFVLEGGMSGTPTSSDLYLGSDATMIIEFGNLRLGSVEFHPDSTVLFRNPFGDALYNHFNANNTVMGDLQVGVGGGFKAVVDLIGGDRTVQGDVLVTKGGDKIRWALNARLAVKGNFTDNSTDVYRTNSGDPFSVSGSAVDPVGSDTLIFYGNPATPSIVSIAHSMAGVDLQIGDPGTIGGNHDGSDSTGNVLMATDLHTLGSAYITANSRLDVADKTLTAGSFTGENPINLAYTFGTDSGLIDSTGNLHLNTFNLTLTHGGGWAYFDELLLINYNGTLLGAPTFGTVTLDPAFQHGPLIVDTINKELRVQIFPEPSALTLACGAMVMLARRRRN